MGFLFFLLVMGGGIWLAVSWYESGKKKIGQAVVAQPTAAPLPPWRVGESLWHTEGWLSAVAASAREAHALAVPVPLEQIEAYLQHGRTVTDGIRRKVDAIRRTHGEDLLALPCRAQQFLDRDDENLRRLSARLESLHKDLIVAMTRGGLTEQRRFQELDDNLRAIGWALQQFPR
jgi:hypothetical protein